MRRRATMARSSSSVIGATMNAFIAFVICCVVGRAVGYNVKREAPYNLGPNDPYTAVANSNYHQEPSQRLFWSNQGSNQVGGTGLWATLTNKFPILGNMFGRMELATEYGAPSQNSISTQYGAPARIQPQFYQNLPNYQQQNTQQLAQQYPQLFSAQYPRQYSSQYPQQFSQQYPQQFSQQYPQQFSQQYPEQFAQQYPRQYPQQFDQRFIPSSRDVGITDDAVIVTPPQVPIAQPAPAPVPVPIPSPVPAPSPEPSGYTYNKPQYRLELPYK